MKVEVVPTFCGIPPKVKTRKEVAALKSKVLGHDFNTMPRWKRNLLRTKIPWWLTKR